MKSSILQYKKYVYDEDTNLGKISIAYLVNLLCRAEHFWNYSKFFHTTSITKNYVGEFKLCPFHNAKVTFQSDSARSNKNKAELF